MTGRDEGKQLPASVFVVLSGAFSYRQAMERGRWSRVIT